MSLLRLGRQPPMEMTVDKADPSPKGGGLAKKDEINILLLEDNARDADLVRRALRAGEIHFRLTCVDTKAAFVNQLIRSPPDLILSDYSLPTFDGYSALQLALQKCPNSPFIFVTGTLGEEVAIETLKKGATDYVLKQRLTRLVPAVHRALNEARQWVEHQQAQAKLRESHKQLRTLSVYLQHVREEERIRIAREVHDVLGQALTGLKLQLTWLTSRLPRSLAKLHNQAHDMAGHIDEVIKDVRRIATELRPGVLDNAGLLAALEWQAGQFEMQTGIHCRVRSNLKETIWDQDLNTTCFRIFQEALTNIVRHAGATKVETRLVEMGGHLILSVKDNGRGISEAEIRNTSSIGLLGMRERASLLGGEIRLRGDSGKGTTISVRIPLPSRRTGKIHFHENSPRG